MRLKSVEKYGLNNKFINTQSLYFCIDIKELNKTVEFLSYENVWKALKNLLRPVTYCTAQDFDETFLMLFTQSVKT